MVQGGESLFEDEKFENIEKMLQFLLMGIVFRSWHCMLYNMRLLEAFGKNSIPIFAAAQSILWFSLIAMFYFLSMVHVYYVINVWNLEKSFLILLGDVDLFEMQDADPLYEQISDNGETLLLEENDPDEGGMRHVIQLLFIVVSAGGTVLLMNIFIAVLCKSYDLHVDKVEGLFRRSRLQVVVDKFATNEGWRRLWRMDFKIDDRFKH